MSKADLTGSGCLTADFDDTVPDPGWSDSVVGRRDAGCRLPHAASSPISDPPEQDHEDQRADGERLEVQLRYAPHILERVLQTEEDLDGAWEDRDPRTKNDEAKL